MNRKLLLIALMLVSAPAVFAQKYMTRTARISFNATAPKSPENIEAINNEVANIVDAKSGDIVFQVPVKSFKFQRALMQEHFNENYMESDKFPRSEFKGKISNMSDVNFAKDGTYNATATGRLTIHGVTKEVNVPGTVTVKGSSAKLKAKFVVKLSDYNVSVPSVVADKVGKEATIMLDSDLAQK
ncbi:MAG: YceI family protein [Bacteroidota bacterium]